MIWTTAALVVSQHGIARAGEAFAYLGGALAGMADMILACFGGWRATWSDVGLVRRAYGAIHAGLELSRLCGAFHSRGYAEFRTMWSCAR